MPLCAFIHAHKSLDVWRAPLQMVDSESAKVIYSLSVVMSRDDIWRAYIFLGPRLIIIS